MPFSVLTQMVTTTRQDGSVSTSEVTHTLFPTADSQAASQTSSATSNSAHTLPVGTVIGIVGGIVAVLIILLLLFLCHRQRKAIDNRFATMGLGSNNNVMQGK